MMSDSRFDELTEQLKQFLLDQDFEDLAGDVAMEYVKAPGRNASLHEEEECREQLWIARHRIITKVLLTVAMERVQ